MQPRSGINPHCGSWSRFSLIGNKGECKMIGIILQAVSSNMIQRWFFGKPRSPFFGRIIKRPTFQSFVIFSVCQIESIMLIRTWLSSGWSIKHYHICGCIPESPGELFFNFWIAFLISSSVGSWSHPFLLNIINYIQFLFLKNTFYHSQYQVVGLTWWNLKGLAGLASLIVVKD